MSKRALRLVSLIGVLWTFYPAAESRSALVESCIFQTAGDACIFDVIATAKGNLSVDTQAATAGEWWRVTLAELNNENIQSAIGNGSMTEFTGAVSQKLAVGGSYIVIVTYEQPLPGNFPTGVVVRFSGAVEVSLRTVFSWAVGDWGQCSVECGGGVQTRTVTCQDQSGQVVADANCDAGSKPSTTQPCNTQPC